MVHIKDHRDNLGLCSSCQGAKRGKMRKEILALSDEKPCKYGGKFDYVYLDSATKESLSLFVILHGITSQGWNNFQSFSLVEATRNSPLPPPVPSIITTAFI